MEIANLSFGPHRVRFDFAEPTIRPGVGIHRLAVPMTVQASWLDPDDPRSTAALLVEGYVWADPALRPVGSTGTTALSIRGFPTHEELALAVGDEQLYALETLRGQGDLTFRLDLRGVLIGAAPTTHPTSETQVAYRISVARWLVLLDQVGAELGVTVRVRSPLTDAWTDASEARPPDAPSLLQAAQRLRQARLALRENDYERCVQSCRRVLENIARLDPPPSAKVVFATPAKERDQVQRWGALHHDLVSLSSAAFHDDAVTDRFSWSRSDAEAVLAMTAGLLARFQP